VYSNNFPFFFQKGEIRFSGLKKTDYEDKIKSCLNLEGVTSYKRIDNDCFLIYYKSHSSEITIRKHFASVKKRLRTFEFMFRRFFPADKSIKVLGMKEVAKKHRKTGITERMVTELFEKILGKKGAVEECMVINNCSANVRFKTAEDSQRVLDLPKQDVTMEGVNLTVQRYENFKSCHDIDEMASNVR
jgi:hypothetical protein